MIKNMNFLQFNKLVPQIIVKLSNEKPSAVPVYMALVSLSNNVGCSIVPQSKLGDLIGKSTRTIARLINFLGSKHYIGIARSGRANVYILNYNLIWQTYGYKKALIKKYIKFPANVVLTQSQNPNFFKKFRKFVKQNGHKSIDLKKLQQKSVKPNMNPNRNKSRKLKQYSNRAEAIKHNGYYQPSLLEQNKKPVKNN